MCCYSNNTGMSLNNLCTIPTTAPSKIVKDDVNKSKYIRNENGHYVCPHCNKVTEHQNTMYYHIKKQHQKDLPFTCTRCSNTPKFLQKSSYLCHLATIHENDPKLTEKEKIVLGCEENSFTKISYSCPAEGCKHTTHTKANIKVHYARTHAKDWIPSYVSGEPCKHCDENYSSSTAYYYHSLECFKECASQTQLNTVSRIR